MPRPVFCSLRAYENSHERAPTDSQQYEIQNRAIRKFDRVFSLADANSSKDEISAEHFGWFSIHLSLPRRRPAICDKQPAILRTDDLEIQMVWGVALELDSNLVRDGQTGDGTHLGAIRRCRTPFLVHPAHFFPRVHHHDGYADLFRSLHESGIRSIGRRHGGNLVAEPDTVAA